MQKILKTDEILLEIAVYAQSFTVLAPKALFLPLFKPLLQNILTGGTRCSSFQATFVEFEWLPTFI